MRDKYFDIISQTFDFPKEEFDVQDNELLFNGVPLMEIIEHYGTPLKLNYLPKITEQIQKAKSWFNYAIEDLDYKGI